MNPCLQMYLLCAAMVFFTICVVAMVLCCWQQEAVDKKERESQEPSIYDIQYHKYHDYEL